MAIVRLTDQNTVLLVVDVQAKLLPHIDAHELLTDQIVKLIAGCKVLDVPILATEQYRKGLGPTVEPVAAQLPEGAMVAEKLKFSACIGPVRQRLSDLGRPVVLLCGVEAHVCVMQTALDLADAGYMVALAADAVGSRRPGDRRLALRRMEQAGILPVSVEMALLEMTHEAGTERFRALLPIIK